MHPVQIHYIPQGAREVQTVAECDTIREAEDFIASLLMWANPEGVEAGDYSIDYPEWMEP